MTKCNKAHEDRDSLEAGDLSMVYRVPGRKKKVRRNPVRKEVMLCEDDEANMLPVECDTAEGVAWETDECIFISRPNPISKRRKRTVIDLRPALVLRKEKKK